MLLTERMAYLELPKTGTSWVRKALAACGIAAGRPHGPHLTRASAQPFIGERFVWTTIRNPFTWMESVYRWLARNDWPELPGGTERLRGSRRGISWAEWMADYLRDRPGLLSQVYQQYSVGADFVGKTEDLPGSLLFALKMAHHPFDEDVLRNVPPENVACHRRAPYAFCDWTDDMRAALLTAEKDIFEQYYPEELGRGEKAPA